MSDPTNTRSDAHQDNEDAREAASMGEKPDLGRERDALIDAVSGSGMGSDTRAGSLRGGSVSGSDVEPDQVVIDEALAREGRASAPPKAPSSVDPSDVKNTGVTPGDEEPDAPKTKGADAATG